MGATFQLIDAGQTRPKPIAQPAPKYTCRCGQPARPKPLGQRGDHPKLCFDCHRESLRKSWRDTKRRRANKYGVHVRPCPVPEGGNKYPAHPLARGRAAKWRFEKYAGLSHPADAAIVRAS